MSETPLVLRRLRLSDEADVRSAIEEFAAEGGTWSYRHRDDLPWPDYVALVHGWEDGRDLPEGFVAHADLVADVGGRVVGRSSIRFELNDFLRSLGGHIGYAVRPAFRRRGYATEILRQSVELARRRGISPALVTCDDGNDASRRVIEANGGELEDIVLGEPGQPRKRRYWVS